MSEYRCPKCAGPMDLGMITCTQGHIFFKSDSQGILTMTTPVDRALACPQCGYVEFYLDPGKLRQSLGR
jgi:predicted nucleic-acid-binding Zn-ribbon protein